MSYARHRQRHRAALMWRLAREPRFKWFGRWTGPNTRAKVRSYIARAGALQPGAVPLMVVMRLRGFMLNVTHHDWTRANIRHGLALSRMVRGKPFIVNTSYNGRGPLPVGAWWPTRALMYARYQTSCLGPPRGTVRGHYRG